MLNSLVDGVGMDPALVDDVLMVLGACSLTVHSLDVCSLFGTIFAFLMNQSVLLVPPAISALSLPPPVGLCESSRRAGLECGSQLRAGV